METLIVSTRWVTVDLAAVNRVITWPWRALSPGAFAACARCAAPGFLGQRCEGGRLGVYTLAIASLNFDSPVYFYFFRLYRVLTYLVFFCFVFVPSCNE